MILESLLKIKQKEIQLQFRITSIMDIILYQNSDQLSLHPQFQYPWLKYRETQGENVLWG